MNSSDSLIPASEMMAVMKAGLPGMDHRHTSVVHAEKHAAVLRLAWNETQLRPGGTISGPTMMALADAAMYAAILATVGPELLAVTTDFNIHFLRRPPPAEMTASARIIKLGQRLIVLTVEIHSGAELVAHASGSYARPPAKNAA